MSLSKKLVTGIVGAIAGMVLAIPAPATASPLADCTASLNVRLASWTATCAAPHTVTIRIERWWHWLGSSEIHMTTGNMSRLVAPGTPWSDRILFIPEQRTVFLCMSAYQDTTTPITPRICSSW